MLKHKLAILILGIIGIIVISLIAYKTKVLPSGDNDSQGTDTNKQQESTYIYPVTQRDFPSQNQKYILAVYPPQDYRQEPPQQCPFKILDQQANVIDISNLPIEYINCNGNPYAGVITDFKGWINDSHILVENQQGIIDIIDILGGQHSTYNYDRDKYWFSAVNQKLDLWLLEKKNPYFTYDVLDSQKQILASDINFNVKGDMEFIVDTVYDWVNQGFLFIIKRDFQPPGKPIPPLQTTTEFHFMPIEKLEPKLVYKTPQIELIGKGCTSSQIQPQPQSILITPGCYSLPEDSLDNQGRFLLEL